MVDDFFEEAQENVKKRANRAKHTRVVKGLVPFTHPTARKSGAT